MAKAKKKWAHMRGKTTHTVKVDGVEKTYTITPRGDSDDVTHNDVVRALRDKWKAHSFTEQLANWNDFEDQKAGLERALSECNANITALERLVFEHMDAADMEDITAGNGYFTRDTGISAKQIDRAGVTKWALEHMPDIVSVHAGVLNSQVKHALDVGGDLPEGIDIESFDRIVRKKA
jgi:hypothetical protein